MWFERAFTFKLGPHLLRGRVDRVDRLSGRRVRADRLQDRPAQERGSAGRRRAAVAVRGRRARGLAARVLHPGLLLPARRPEGRPVPVDGTTSGCARSRSRSARGSSRRVSSRRRRSRPARSATTGWSAPRRSAEQRAGLLEPAGPRRTARRRRAGAGTAGAPGRSSRPRAAARRLVRLLGSRRLLEPLDERLHVGIALHGRVDLALVVGRGVFELGGVDRDPDQALELADQRERGLRVGCGGDVVGYRGPQARATAGLRPGTRREARRRSRSAPRSEERARPSRADSAVSEARPVTLIARVCGTSASSAPSVTTSCVPSASARSITTLVNVRQRNDGSLPGQQDQVARRPGNPRLVQLDLRPLDRAGVVLDQLDPRARALEVVELLGVDGGEPLRVERAAHERDALEAESAASFQPLNAQISAGARNPSGRYSHWSGCIRTTVHDGQHGLRRFDHRASQRASARPGRARRVRVHAQGPAHHAQRIAVSGTRFA